MNPDRETHRQPASAAPLQQKEPRQCLKCNGDYVVLYEMEPGEALERAPVACPHCWQLDYVMVSSSSRWGRSYRAEKTE